MLSIFLGPINLFNNSKKQTLPIPSASSVVSDLGDPKVKSRLESLALQIERSVLNKLDERAGTKWENADVPEIRDLSIREGIALERAVDIFLIRLNSANLLLVEQKLTGKVPSFILNEALKRASESLDQSTVDSGKYREVLLKRLGF